MSKCKGSSDRLRGLFKARSSNSRVGICMYIIIATVYC